MPIRGKVQGLLSLFGDAVSTNGLLRSGISYSSFQTQGVIIPPLRFDDYYMTIGLYQSALAGAGQVIDSRTISLRYPQLEGFVHARILTAFERG